MDLFFLMILLSPLAGVVIALTLFCFIVCRDGSRTVATSKMERFVIIVGWKPPLV